VAFGFAHGQDGGLGSLSLHFPPAQAAFGSNEWNNAVRESLHIT